MISREDTPLSWKKMGLVFSPESNFGWMNSHAQIPTVLALPDRLRVYFSTRAKAGESQIAMIDLDRNDPKIVLKLYSKPVLDFGEPGTFDEHGTMPSGVVKHQGRIFLFYSGWSRRTSVPYSNLTGLAISDDDGIQFKRVGKGPVLTTKLNEPFSATSPHVFIENGKWHSHYCSGTQWILKNDKYEHVYDIKYAVSNDGIEWHQDGITRIGPKFPEEAITRPVVWRGDENYHMLFCFRGSSDFRNGGDAYRIGYASSTDLKNWHRNDDIAGINRSPADNDWDHKMMAYPYVVKLPEKTLLFYNGNGFGQSGFGFAELQSDR